MANFATPRAAFDADSRTMGETDLNGNRDAWITDLGDWVPEVTYQDFLNLYLPNMDSDTVAAIRSKLENLGALLTMTAARKSLWKAFPKAPQDYRVHETEVFRKLEPICSSIITAGKEVLSRTPNAFFKTTPGATFESEVMNATFRSDGYFAIPPKGPADSSPESMDCSVEASEGNTGEGPSNEGSRQECSSRAKSANMKQREPTRRSKRSKGKRGNGKLKNADPLQPAEQAETTRVKESDVAALFEGKKHATVDDLEDDIRKIIGSASHCLYNDPCRRFMFGLTIENTDARLWYFSRSAVIVSKHFNFQQDVDVFIHFVTSLAFAKDHELGYDPTVARYVGKDGKIGYKYRVEKTWYLTVECLSDYLSARIVGRSTRVWKVCRWDDRDLKDPPYFALKDYWIDDTSPTELEIQKRIFERINKVNPLEDIGDKSQWAQHFMEIEADEIVSFDEDGQRLVDRTELVPSLRWKFFIVPSKAHRTASRPSAGTRSKPAGATTNLPSKTITTNRAHHRFFARKKHCRVLFRDVGKRLDALTNLHTLFTALVHGLQGLKIMYSAGYVHRDISAGNILLCGDRGKISDLEYSRPFEEVVDETLLEKAVYQPPSDEKTGTPAFMAIEVSSDMYHFVLLNPEEQARNAATRHSGGSYAAAAAAAAASATEVQSGAQVIHNYLHDLESIWWIGLYALFTTTPTTTLSDCPLSRLSGQKHQVDQIFPHCLGLVPARVAIWTKAKQLETICDSYLVKESIPAANHVIGALWNLYAYYVEFEKDMEKYRQERKFGSAYGSLSKHLMSAASTAITRVTHLRDLKIPDSEDETLPTPGSSSKAVRSQSSRGSKRKASVEDGERGERNGVAEPPNKRSRKPQKRVK